MSLMSDHEMITIGKKEDGRALKLDVGRLIVSRVLVTATSGGGKSDGIKGYSPIAMAREMIAAGKAEEIFGATFFGNGAHVKGVLETAAKLDSRQQMALQESWNAQYAGVGNAHKTPVLHNGLSYKPISIAPNDAQFIESRKFSVDEVARIYRIPLHMLAQMVRGAGTVEQMSLEFLIYTLMPWLEKWEAELNRKLFPDHKFHVRFDERRLLRADMDARQRYHSIARQWGWESSNDVRRDEGMAPIGPQGDIYLSPANMWSAWVVLEGKSHTQSAGVAGGEKPGGPPVTAQGFTTPGGGARGYVLHEIFADSLARMLRKEANAQGRGKADEDFYSAHRTQVREALYPAARSLLAVLGKDLTRETGVAIDAVLGEVAEERHLQLYGNVNELATDRAGRMIRSITEADL